MNPKTVSKVMREMQAKRKVFAGGRPRKADRCECGKYTKHTASLRKHECSKIVEDLS